MLELVLAAAIAGVALFFLYSAFAGASTGSLQAIKKVNTAQAQPKKPKKVKKAEAEAAKEEGDLERLIAAQAVSVSGMTTDKQRVISLEDVKQEKRPEVKKGGNRSTQQPVVSTQQRLMDQQQGFQVVERKEKAPSPVAPAHTVNADKDKDRELSRFFRNQDKKGKKSSVDYTPKNAKKEEQTAAGKVMMKKKLTSDPSAIRDAWAEREN